MNQSRHSHHFGREDFSIQAARKALARDASHFKRLLHHGPRQGRETGRAVVETGDFEVAWNIEFQGGARF